MVQSVGCPPLCRGRLQSMRESPCAWRRERRSWVTESRTWLPGRSAATRRWQRRQRWRSSWQGRKRSKPLVAMASRSAFQESMAAALMPPRAPATLHATVGCILPALTAACAPDAATTAPISSSPPLHASPRRPLSTRLLFAPSQAGGRSARLGEARGGGGRPRGLGGPQESRAGGAREGAQGGGSQPGRG